VTDGVILVASRGLIAHAFGATLRGTGGGKVYGFDRDLVIQVPSELIDDGFSQEKEFDDPTENEKRKRTG